MSWLTPSYPPPVHPCLPPLVIELFRLAVGPPPSRQTHLEHTIEAAETWIKVAAFATMLDPLAPKLDTPQA